MFFLYIYVYFFDSCHKNTIEINWIVASKMYCKNRLKRKLFVRKAILKFKSLIANNF